MMAPKKLESQFIQRVMCAAAEADVEDATRRWFEFLKILDRIAAGYEEHANDSHEIGSNGRFPDDINEL
jgi:hypothetical protein